jgi:hypothetical protein
VSGPLRLLIALAALASLLPSAAWSAYPGQDPNWPCQQRLVPSLSAAAFWSGPALDGPADWHAEPRVADLVNEIAPRKVSQDAGQAAIAAFVKDLSAEERTKLVPLAFVGLLEETNRQRGELIERIKNFGQRQRNLADLVARVTSELDAAPAQPQGAEADQRAELEQRKSFLIREFEEAQKTIRYACETPVQLEARLGAYARALQGALR